MSKGLCNPGHEAIDPYIEDQLNENEIDSDRLATLTPREAFDAWLKFEGIIGYTDQIIKMWEALKASAE